MPPADPCFTDLPDCVAAGTDYQVCCDAFVTCASPPTCTDLLQSCIDAGTDTAICELDFYSCGGQAVTDPCLSDLETCLDGGGDYQTCLDDALCY